MSDEEVYEEVTNNPSALECTIFTAVNKIRAGGDLSAETLEYFFIKSPKFSRFSLLPKIRKRLHNVPGRPVISNCDYNWENFWSSLDYHLQPLAKKVDRTLKIEIIFSKSLKY